MVDLTDVTDDDNDDSETILVPKVEVEDIPTEGVHEEDETTSSIWPRDENPNQTGIV